MGEPFPEISDGHSAELSRSPLALTHEQQEFYQAGFEPFREVADHITGEIAQARIAAGADPSNGRNDEYIGRFGRPHNRLEGIKGYLGAGMDKTAFRVMGADGRRAVLKAMAFPVDGRQSPTKLELSVAPLVAAQGDEHVEQLIGVDQERGLIVTTPASGEMIIDMSLRARIRRIEAWHIDGLGETAAFMRAKHLHYHHAGGIFFDPRGIGFNIIDPVLDGRGSRRGRIDTTEAMLDFILTDHQELDRLAREMEGVHPKYWQPDEPIYQGSLGRQRKELLEYAHEVDVRMGIAE